MLRSAPLLAAILLAGLTFACVPPPPPPPVAAGGAKLGTTGICTAGQNDSDTKFAAAVQVLQPNYNPSDDPTEPPLKHVQSYHLRKEIIADLEDAFRHAPLIVQKDLCGLTGVFIDPTGCPNNTDVNNCSPFDIQLFSQNRSWGFRGPSRNNNSKGDTYIAISGGLWPSGGDSHASLFSDYQRSIIRHFARLVTVKAEPDNSWLTVLAALAHELGHVRRAQIAIPGGYGTGYDFTRLKKCPVDGDEIDFYSGWSHGSGADDKKLQPRHRWRHLDDNSNNDNTITRYKNMQLRSGHKESKAYRIYQADQPWASLFGAQNPDEDFAETYALYALIGKKFDDGSFDGNYLQHLWVWIGLDWPVDVPGDILSGGRNTLAKKIKCLKVL